MLLDLHRDSTDHLGRREPGSPPRLSLMQFLSSESGVRSFVQHCFTFTETVRIIRDGGSPGRPPRLSLTQLLSSESGVCLLVHSFNVAWPPQTVRTIRDGGSPGRPPRLSLTQRRSSESGFRSFCFCLMSSDAKSIFGTICKVSLSWIYHSWVWCSRVGDFKRRPPWYNRHGRLGMSNQPSIFPSEVTLGTTFCVRIRSWHILSNMVRQRMIELLSASGDLNYVRISHIR